jgi:hypothetical protein
MAKHEDLAKDEHGQSYGLQSKSWLWLYQRWRNEPTAETGPGRFRVCSGQRIALIARRI